MTDDSIVRDVFIAAPPERVWQALTDHRAFGAWFRVALDGPFAPGRETTGAMTYPGHEGAPWRSVTEAMEPPRRFAFRWPHDENGAAEAWTRVEFTLTAEGDGTRVTVTESGLAALPPDRRASVLRDNAQGWEIQTGNLKAHVEA